MVRRVRFEVEGEREALELERDDEAGRARFVWLGEPVLLSVRDGALYGAGGAWGATHSQEADYSEWFAPGVLGASDEQLERRRESERARGYQYERRAFERFRARGEVVLYELTEGGSAFGESWSCEVRVTLDLRSRRGTLSRQFARSE